MEILHLSDGGSVLAIECVGGSSKAEEWGGDAVQSGDVVEEIRIGGSPAARAPFKGGKTAVQKMLHAAFKRGDTSIEVGVRRAACGERKELQACIVPHPYLPVGKKQYVLRSIHDPNYTVGFVDRSEKECIALQGTRSSRVVTALSKAQLQDGYVLYPWDKKMNNDYITNQNLPGGSFLSMLVLPKALDAASTRYDSLEDTLARANAWLLSARASGVPISFVSIQTEGLLTKISGETASATVGSMADLENLTNVSLYGFEDYHGVDIGVVKAVRLWYSADGGEYPVEITLNERDTKLGFAVSRTDEGFIYISSVEEDDTKNEAPSTRSGLRDLYKQAKRASKLLIISRVSSEKVLPWMVSPSGSIRCYDTISLSQKLSLHRQSLIPFSIHVLMWENPVVAHDGRISAPPPPASTETPVTPAAAAPPAPPSTPELPKNLVFGDEVVEVEREPVGDVSFRFDDVLLPSSWV